MIFTISNQDFTTQENYRKFRKYFELMKWVKILDAERRRNEARDFSRGDEDDD